MQDLLNEYSIKVLWYFLDKFNHGIKKVPISEFNNEIENEINKLDLQLNCSALFDKEYIIKEGNYYHFVYGPEFLRDIILQYQQLNIKKEIEDKEKEESKFICFGIRKEELDYYKTSVNELLNNKIYEGFSENKIYEDLSIPLISKEDFNSMTKKIEDKILPLIRDEYIDKFVVNNSLLVPSNVKSAASHRYVLVTRHNCICKIIEQMLQGYIYYANIVTQFIKNDIVISLIHKGEYFKKQLEILNQELCLPEIIYKDYLEMNDFINSLNDYDIRQIYISDDSIEVLKLFIKYKIESIFNELKGKEYNDICAEVTKAIMNSSYRFSKEMIIELSESILVTYKNNKEKENIYNMLEDIIKNLKEAMNDEYLEAVQVIFEMCNRKKL